MISGEPESPIEEILLHQIRSDLERQTSLTLQEEFKTQWGKFRPDFTLRHQSLPLPITLECDGKDFHDGMRDEIRDSLLLGSGQVGGVFRFRGCDLHYHAEDCAYVLMRWHPEVFSERGRNFIENEASEKIRDENLSPRDCQHVAYGFLKNGAVDFMSVEHLDTQGRQFWRECYEFAKSHPRMNLDGLCGQWRSDLRSLWSG